MLNTCHGYDDHMYNNCMCYPNMAHKCDCLPFHKGNNNKIIIIAHLPGRPM